MITQEPPGKSRPVRGHKSRPTATGVATRAARRQSACLCYVVNSSEAAAMAAVSVRKIRLPKSSG